MKKVTIYTDGACEGNPGPGGWAAILQHGVATKEISGAEAATTNNRMELQAAINALESLKEPCEVDAFTDSEYLRQGVTEWMPIWRARNWLRGRKSVKNEDLWRKLEELTRKHMIHWHWVRGHSGHPENERCDQLAVQAIAELKKRLAPEELQARLREFQAERNALKAQPSFL